MVTCAATVAPFGPSDWTTSPVPTVTDCAVSKTAAEEPFSTRLAEPPGDAGKLSAPERARVPRRVTSPRAVKDLAATEPWIVPPALVIVTSSTELATMPPCQSFGDAQSLPSQTSCRPPTKERIVPPWPSAATVQA